MGYFLYNQNESLLFDAMKDFEVKGVDLDLVDENERD